MQKKHLTLAVLVTAVWGLNFPITKLGLAAIDPLLLTALRFMLAALPWVFFVRRPPIAIGWLAAYGLIFGVAMWALINLGIELGVPPGTAALLIQFSAFFTLGWGVLLFREHLSLGQILGVGLAALGLISIIFSSPGHATTVGYGLLLVSAFSWSIGNVIIKRSKVRECSPLRYGPACSRRFPCWYSLGWHTVPLRLPPWQHTLSGCRCSRFCFKSMRRRISAIGVGIYCCESTRFPEWHRCHC